MDEKKPIEQEEVKNEAHVAETTAEAPAVAPQPAPEVAEAPVAEAETAPALAEEPVAEVPEASAAAPGAADTAESEEPQRPAPTTKEEVVERLREIVQNSVQTKRSDIELLKQIFYHLHNNEIHAAREAFVAAGGAPEDFQPETDPMEEAFKAEMDRVKEMRAKEAAEEEAQKQDNLKRKLDIIEKIKGMSASAEDADKNYDEFKKLQAEWKEIKAVPQENATELWKNYQLYVEHYYDQLHLNHEARMYDFKKNLERKLQLCEAAERLADVDDVVSAFHQLQNLHQEFREIGPVEKEKREEIWERFKAASTVVNKRHQAHFENLKAQEEENLVKKTALCEKVEALKLDDLKSLKEWEALTEEVKAIQSEWKTIGFTPKKMNTKIFERFRSAIDNIFKRKSEYFKNVREALQANLDKKNQLVEEAEALKESTDWAETTKKIVALQAQWKEIGPVPHKVSDAVWKRFNGACNYFFEKKSEVNGNRRKEEKENLEKKNDIIRRLEALLTDGADDVRGAVAKLQDEWKAVGHVPFKQKEKVYEAYRAVQDRIFDELHISTRRRSVDNFRAAISKKGGGQLETERQRLQAAYDAKLDEIRNYETNLGFFSSKSQKGNSLMDEITKKIDRLKEDLQVIKEKLQLARQQEKAEAAPASAEEKETPAADNAEA